MKTSQKVSGRPVKSRSYVFSNPRERIPVHAQNFAMDDNLDSVFLQQDSPGSSRRLGRGWLDTRPSSWTRKEILENGRIKK